jgi:uncharacterized protein
MTARPNFIELPARDIEKSKAFYRSVFAWTLTDFGPSYACTMTGDVDVGLQGDRAEASAAPLPVICVADLEAALAAVTRPAGGSYGRFFVSGRPPLPVPGSQRQ